MVEPHDPIILPANLPAPVDDGAADHLTGLALPSISLPSTQGGAVDLAVLSQGKLVLYVYPRTGRPGVSSQPGMGASPGARGCTPQSCAFRDHHARFVQLGFAIAGLSAQSSDDQLEAATRLRLPFSLLADPELRLAAALDLPTFSIAGLTLYKRLTLIAAAGRIVKVFYPVFSPDEHAVEARAWLARPAPAAENDGPRGR